MRNVFPASAGVFPARVDPLAPPFSLPRLGGGVSRRDVGSADAASLPRLGGGVSVKLFV